MLRRRAFCTVAKVTLTLALLSAAVYSLAVRNRAGKKMRAAAEFVKVMNEPTFAGGLLRL